MPSQQELRAGAARLLRTKPPPQLPVPKNAYGVCLTDGVLVAVGEELRKAAGCEFDPDNAAHISTAKILAAEELPKICLVVVPELSLSKWRAHLVRTKDDSVCRLLVLADDSSEAAKEMKNSPAVVKELLSFLRLKDQVPAWYPVIY
ncbi:hypothetical protein HGRIS_003250 [Hohenbuehelia grisea]|uniref:Uncharacterized protein n=1 Tax=Hohenbuehelia grisea TaxID=104357 RepID=A0ABR3JPD9_9AGAR